MATGSNLINTSSQGQPADNEDRPFSFAIGTQIFLNPSDDPTSALISFKADASLLAGSLASGASTPPAPIVFQLVLAESILLQTKLA